MKFDDFDSNQNLSNVSKLTDVFGQRFMLLLEKTIFALTDGMVPGYAGGQWAWISPEHPILVPVRDDTMNVVIQSNMYGNENTDPDAYGHAVSLVAFNHILNAMGIANEKMIDRYWGMRNFSLDTLEGEANTQYIQMID